MKRDRTASLTYQIRLKDSIATGTRLENKAAIYFDFNTPIITNYAWHTIGRDFLINCLANKCNNTATTEITPIQTFDIYPNPNRGVFDVALSLSKPAMVKLFLVNTLGQIVRSTNVGEVLNLSNVTNITTYDISALPNGIYMIKAVVDGQVMVRKVVVQNAF